MAGRWRWQPPPGWPMPPDRWAPGPGWMPELGWPAPPPGWTWWRRDPAWYTVTRVLGAVVLTSSKAGMFLSFLAVWGDPEPGEVKRTSDWYAPVLITSVVLLVAGLTLVTAPSHHARSRRDGPRRDPPVT